MLTSRVVPLSLCSFPRGLASVAFLIFAGSPAFGVQSPFVGGPSSSVSWPDTFDGQNPTLAVAGDFTGDHYKDVAYVCNGKGVLAYGPGTYDSLVALPGVVKDMARFPEAPGSSTDRLLVLDALGLRILSNYQAGAFTNSRITGEGPWSGAKRVITGDADGDNTIDAVGVAADGVTILFSSSMSGGANNPTTFSLPSPVIDLVIARWSPEPAIVALTVGGLYVHRSNGDYVDSYVGGDYQSAKLSVLRENGVPHERVAAVYKVGGTDFLSVVDKNGPGAFWQLGAIGAYGLCTGDVDGNGHGDLVVLQRFNHHGLLFRNQGPAGGGFSPLEGIDMGLGNAPATLQAAQPILADFTNDSDLDLLVHIAVNDELVLVENNTFSRTAGSPKVEGGDYFYSFVADTGHLVLSVKTPVVAGFVPTDIDLVVWTQDEPGVPMNAQAYHNDQFTLDAAGYAQVELDTSEPELETAKIYHLEMRPVLRSAGSITKVGPTAIWSFATSDSDVFALEASSGNSGVPIRIFLLDEERYLTASEEDERILTPSTVEGDKVPPTDEPPDPFGN